MPKNYVEYCNTIIYKIYCKDENITDVYVGHTTNFIQRKYAHKIACNNLNNNLKIYTIIKHNGGWDNWDMIEIAKYNCKDATEARIKEQEHYNSLNTTLNSCSAYVDKKLYFCDTCNLQCTTSKQYKIHMNCNKHIKIINKDGIFCNKEEEEIKKSSKIPSKYCCELCYYNTSYSKDFKKHLLTKKHKEMTGNVAEMPKIAKVSNNNCQHCGQKYLSQSGLWKHLKKCHIIDAEDIEIDEPTDKQIILMLIKDNSEIKNMMIEQHKYMMDHFKNGTHNTTNNNTNCGNKTFNLQVFLNETCKDAINMSDFVNQLQVSLSELETTGKIGYVEGISKVFIKNLNEINYTDRPIHCCDSKREILYIKEDNKWTKDDEQKTGLTKAIKYVANKNIKQISEWQKLHPDFSDPDSKENDKYMKIVLNSMSGSTKEESDKNYEKIAKNVIKEVVIEK